MIYVMSDIHEDKESYNSIMSKINLKSDDRLYILGDIIDVMPYGIDILLDVMKRKNVTVLLGNHEFMMKKTISNLSDTSNLQKWLKNGGSVTISKFVTLTTRDKFQVQNYIHQMSVSINVTVNNKEYILVHAAPSELYNKLPSSSTDRTHFSVWTRLKPNDTMPIGKTVIFGHTPTECYQEGTPLRIWYGKNKIGIDCGSGNENRACRLACLRLDDITEFYSD